MQNTSSAACHVLLRWIFMKIKLYCDACCVCVRLKEEMALGAPHIHIFLSAASVWTPKGVIWFKPADNTQHSLGQTAIYYLVFTVITCMRAAARDRGPASGLVWILIPLRSSFGDGNWIRARRDSERDSPWERARTFVCWWKINRDPSTFLWHSRIGRAPRTKADYFPLIKFFAHPMNLLLTNSPAGSIFVAAAAIAGQIRKIKSPWGRIVLSARAGENASPLRLHSFL